MVLFFATSVSIGKVIVGHLLFVFFGVTARNNFVLFL